MALSTQLQAVNTMLGYIGEAPVNSISNTAELPVSAANAVSILDETSKEVQSSGWHFNTEREITVSEILSTHESGELKEIFGTGTAVAVLPISGFGYRDKKFLINPKSNKISIDLKNKLQNIQYGITESFSEWQYKVY